MRRNNSPAVGQHFEKGKTQKLKNMYFANLVFTKCLDVLNSHQAFSFAV